MITRTRGALPLARERPGKIVSFGQCGSDGLAHQNHRNMKPWLTRVHSAPGFHQDTWGQNWFLLLECWGSQQLTLLEADVSLTGQEWKKHPIVAGPGAPCILGIDFLQSGYFKDPKGLRWAFGIAAVEAEGIRQLNTLPGLTKNPSAVGLLKGEEKQVPIATLTMHLQQYWIN